MLMDPSQIINMPDVAETGKSPHAYPLNWVGMEKVEIPLRLSKDLRVPAEADIFVNIKEAGAKGIHMSRIFLALKDAFASENLSLNKVRTILKTFVNSQKGLSDSAKIVLRWDELCERKALLSDYTGWKSYPIELNGTLKNGQFEIWLQFSVFYSSTCPCSAALSRQLFQQEFAKEFCEDNLSFDKAMEWIGSKQVASPHSQRSRADIKLLIGDKANDFGLMKYIDEIEKTLKTPVQTAVKREDEQEFARLNGENTMFVEDALRKMKMCLSPFDELDDFHIKTHHFESLHAHDAVGSVSKF